MLIYSDEAATRLTFLYKGEVEHPMPFEARYSAWISVLVGAPILAFVAYAALIPFDWLPINAALVVLLRVLASLVAGVATAVWLVRRYSSVVTTTRPLAHHAAILVAEVGAPRRRATVEYLVTKAPTLDRTRTITVTRGS